MRVNVKLVLRPVPEQSDHVITLSEPPGGMAMRSGDKNKFPR